MPRRTEPSPEAIANGLLRKWAAKVAAAEGRQVGEVLRSAGILTHDAQQAIYGREMTLSFFERNQKSKEEAED